MIKYFETRQQARDYAKIVKAEPSLVSERPIKVKIANNTNNAICSLNRWAVFIIEAFEYKTKRIAGINTRRQARLAISKIQYQLPCGTNAYKIEDIGENEHFPRWQIIKTSIVPKIDKPTIKSKIKSVFNLFGDKKLV